MRVTEKLRVKINRVCEDNPVFVTWLNTLGGREQWLWHTLQTDSLQTERRADFEPYTTDLENSRGQIKDVNIFAQPKITCYALVSAEDINGLMSITYSTTVEVLSNPDTWEEDGAKWLTYRPEAGSFKVIDSDENEAEVEITFLKAYVNTQVR